MKKILLFLVLLMVGPGATSHPWKPSYYVIVDTDGGVDDIRAISMLLASHDVRVLAITVSPGALSAENAYLKIKSLLNSCRHEGLPLGINRSSKYKPVEFSVALQSVWGDEKKIIPADAPDNMSVIRYVLSAEKSRISFISLGSMTTAFAAMRTIPEFSKQVKEFIWSADGLADQKGFNYNIDREASEKMLKQEIPVKIVRKFLFDNGEFYNSGLIQSIDGINNVYAEKLAYFFSSDHAKNHEFSFSGADDMVPVFLHYPELFVNKTAGTVSDCHPANASEIRESTVRILEGETISETQIIKDLPLEPEFYSDDIQPMVNDIINRYGHDEWFSGVIASEMHRHLGVFEIIGVKMGIRAREYFNTGVDEFNIISYAGSSPPLSCMNDGLQVSTGATPGHGLLKVSDDPDLRPEIDINYMNRKIRVTLKPEIARKISTELKDINYIYGLDSDIYWELVRKNTLKYWRDLDRHEIFEIREIP